MRTSRAVFIGLVFAVGVVASATAFRHMPPFQGRGLHSHPVFQARGHPSPHHRRRLAMHTPVGAPAPALVQPERREPAKYTLQLPGWVGQQDLKYEWKGLQEASTLVRLYTEPGPPRVQRNMFGHPIRMLPPARVFDHTFTVPEALLQEGASLQRTTGGHVTLTAHRAPPAATGPPASVPSVAKPAPKTPPAPLHKPSLRSGRLAEAMAAVQSPAAVQYHPTPAPEPADDPDVLVAEDLGDADAAAGVPVLEGVFREAGGESQRDGEAKSGYMFRGEWHEY